MSDQSLRKPTRRTTAIIIGVLLAVVVIVAVVGLITAAAVPPTEPARSAAPVPASSAAPTPTPTSTPTPTATPTASATPTATADPGVRAAPTPQATKAAPITQSTPAVIKKELGVSVTKMEAVTGAAAEPGEIAGPAVRFTIRIVNSTGKAVALSSTVVNAYYGPDETPAISLAAPGGEPFPASVANGATATGVFVFNIPKDSRSAVQVTVDTSVSNPVIAFKGAAPTS